MRLRAFAQGAMRRGAWLGVAVLIGASITPSVSAQQPKPTDALALRAKVRAYRVSREPAILRELTDFLAIPNIASDSINIRRNAAHIRAMLEKRGITARLLEGPGGPPAVYGELKTRGATKTVVFYAHYDGQPVDTTQWVTPPWTPTMRSGSLAENAPIVQLPSASGIAKGDWRIYARSASDDKSPIIAMLTALDAMRAAGVSPSVNLKFFFEGEEEAGSSNLAGMLRTHASLLVADAWIFCDGPVDQSRKQTVVFGVRGVMGVDVTVYGPNRALHSGHYGNWAPNPAVSIAALVTSIRDEEGRILIDNFYDDVRPKTPAERGAIQRAPSNDSVLQRDLALGRTESAPSPLLEQLMLPALNVRGISSGRVGSAAANAIPVSASVSIDFRLVPAQTTQRVRELFDAHLRKLGYHTVETEPTADQRRAHRKIARVQWDQGYPAYRVSVDHPASRALLKVVSEQSDQTVLAIPTLGGSLPLYLFAEATPAPLLTLPMVNHDNNQHASNENLRLQNLWDGIEMYASVMTRLGTVWSFQPTSRRADEP